MTAIKVTPEMEERAGKEAASIINRDKPSGRDPLSTLRGDPSLDAVWRDVLRGESTRESRAALIAHYRAQREAHFKKKATRDEDD